MTALPAMGTWRAHGRPALRSMRSVVLAYEVAATIVPNLSRFASPGLGFMG